MKRWNGTDASGRYQFPQDEINGVKLVQFGDKIEMDGKHGDIIGHWGSTISDEEFITATLFPNEIRRNYYPQEVNAIFDKIKSIIAE